MNYKKTPLVLVFLLVYSSLARVGLAHNAEHTAQGGKYPSTVLSESKQDSKHPETKRRHIYSAVTSNKTHNSGIRAANRATKITQAVAGTITNREGRRSEPFPIRQSTHVGQSASQQVQDTKIERASQRQSRIPRYRKNTRKQERIQLNFNKKPKPKNLSPRRNVKSVVTDTRGMQTLEKRAFVSAPSTDNSKTLTHDVHLPETILTALRLLLDKRNSFQNDSDALRLASVLLMNKDGKSDGKSGQTIDPAGLAIPERTTSLKTSRINSMNRGMRFIGDLLSGANNTKSSLLTARKSSIWADLVDPTELGVSILKLLFGSKASMVVKPKDKTLLNRVSAEPLDSGRSNGIRVNFHRATPTLSRMEGRRIYHAKRRRPTASESYQTLRLAKLRPGRLTSRGGNSHEKTFTLANAVSELITNLNRKELSEKRKSLFQKKLPTSAVLQRPPAKINVDVNGRRKSWVLLKIPKENNPMENDRQNEPARDVSKSESSNAVLKEGNVLITGKIRPEPLAPQSQNKIPDKDAKAKEMAEKLSEAQDDDLNKSFSSSKLPNDQEALSVLPTQKVTDKEQRLDHQEDLKPSSQSDQSSLMTKKLVQTVQKLLKVVQSSIKAFQTNKQASSAGVPILEPKSSRPAVDSQVPDVKSATGVYIPSEETHLTEAPLSKPLDDTTQSSLERITASARELDPLRGVPTVDEAITVPSPSAIGMKPGPEENVLFQSDTVLGTARDTTDVKKVREDLEAFAEKGLQAHNRLRSVHHAPALRWSDELANQAEKLAYGMAMKGLISRSDVVKSMGEGENIAKLSGLPFEQAGSTATEVWYSEKKNYSYSYPRLDAENDAFTQLIWKSTKELGMGCARDLQTNDMYIVALYRPAGNDKRLLRANVLNEGQVGQDVYATIFKKDRTEKANG